MKHPETSQGLPLSAVPMSVRHPVAVLDPAAGIDTAMAAPEIPVAPADQQGRLEDLTPKLVRGLSRLGDTAISKAEVDASFIAEYGPTFSAQEVQEVPKALASWSLRIVKQEQATLKRLANEHRIDRFSDGLDKLGQVPNYLCGALGVPEGDNKALVQAIITTRLTTANVPTVVNFFQWHDGALAKKQAAFERDEKPKLLSDFGIRLRRAALDGTIPTKTVWRFRELLSKHELMLHLSDTTLMRDYNGSTVHFRNGEELVELEFGNGERAQEATFTHELTHTLSGRSALPGGHEKGALSKSQRGLYRLFGGGMGGRALDEATTEHLADSLIHGHPEIVNPLSDERKNSESYQFSRGLLYILCTFGEKPISPKLFIHAMLEDGTIENSSALQGLESQLREAFPHMDVIDRIRKIDVGEAGLGDIIIGLANDARLAKAPQPDGQRPQITIQPGRLHKLIQRGRHKARAATSS